MWVREQSESPDEEYDENKTNTQNTMSLDLFQLAVVQLVGMQRRRQFLQNTCTDSCTHQSDRRQEMLDTHTDQTTGYMAYIFNVVSTQSLSVKCDLVFLSQGFNFRLQICSITSQSKRYITWKGKNRTESHGKYTSQSLGHLPFP